MKSGSDGDRDDWFAEPATARSRRRVRHEAQRVSGEVSAPQPGTDDDWLTDDGVNAGRRGRRLLDTVSEWRAVLVPLTLAILVIVGLVAGGVFSSGHRPSQPLTAPGVTAATYTGTTAAPATTAVSPAAPTTPLKPGDNGAGVKALQRALNGLGFSVGTPDGVYGPSTQAAVARFQTASHLTSDGVFGPATLAALVSALNGP